MKILSRLFIAIPVLLVFLASCGKDDEAVSLMSVSGNPGEVIVVTTKAQWNGETGKTIRAHFEKPVYGMPQEEPLFNVVRTNTSDFERVFKTFRNVVVIEIDTNRFSKGQVTYHKDVWAKGQLVIKVVASSRDELIELFNANAERMIYTIQTKEFARLYASYRRKPNKEIKKKLKELLKVDVTVPSVAFLATSDTSHAWIRIEREKLKGGYQHEISQGLIIYKYPYTAKQQFLDSNLFAIRDSILKAYIPGPSDGSYMTTEYRYEPPITEEMNFRGHFAKEIHGLWRVENDFMGGPMVSFFVLNEDEGMIYSISGYTFAPQFNKREYYREVEAMARGVKFTIGAKSVKVAM